MSKNMKAGEAVERGPTQQWQSCEIREDWERGFPSSIGETVLRWNPYKMLTSLTELKPQINEPCLPHWISAPRGKLSLALEQFLPFLWQLSVKN